MEHCSEVFVGIDVSKARNAIVVADGGRGGEVRFVGEVDASEESMRRVVKRIAATCDRAHFCYEAGPTGYGLHRLVQRAPPGNRPVEARLHIGHIGRQLILGLRQGDRLAGVTPLVLP